MAFVNSMRMTDGGGGIKQKASTTKKKETKRTVPAPTPVVTPAAAPAPTPAPIVLAKPPKFAQQAPKTFNYPEIKAAPAMPEIAAWSPNQQTNQAYEQYVQAMMAKPGEYQSKYLPDMDALYRQMGERGPFKYDLNADMLYQQMKDQYIRNAQRSMIDTQGQAAALTGGYGNSYAQTAGQQMYDQHLSALNDNISQLYDRKYQEWRDQGQELLQQFNMAGQLENTDYARYRDAVGDWQTDTARAQDWYNSQRNFDYGAYSDDANRTLQRAGMESDNYWNFINAQMNKAGQESNDYWKQQELDMQRVSAERDAFFKTQNKYAQMAMAILQTGSMPNDELLAAAGIDRATATTMMEMYTPAPSGGGGGGSRKQSGKPITQEVIDGVTQARLSGGKEAMTTALIDYSIQGFDTAGLELVGENAARKAQAREKAAADTKKMIGNAVQGFGNWVNKLFGK